MQDDDKKDHRDAELVLLRERLRESEETLEAIRSGDVDAVVVSGDHGQQIYTLTNADRPYRLLIEQMREGAVTLSGAGILLYCNDSFASLVGKPAERMLGAHLREFVVESDRELIQTVFENDRGGVAECNLRGSDGDVPVTLSFSPMPDAIEGRIVCGIVTDLREQQRRSRELSEVSGQLDQQIEQRTKTEAQLHQAQKMEIVGQLTGGLAHDFNNLLMVIGGNLDLIGRRATDEVVIKRIGHIKLAVERGARLNEQLLAFSRKQSLDPEPVCVNDLFPDMELLVRQAAGGRVTVMMHPGENLCFCRADANQLGSAVLNLVINGRDAMPAGGTIDIRTWNAELTQADIQPEFEAAVGRFVGVSVEDHGTGMPPDILSHVFEPFFTTKDVGKGTGLGLSQVYGFVRQSGGQVSISSTVGQGTKVRLFLPWCETPPPTVPSKDTTAVLPVTDRVKILLVEDDEEVRELTIQLLTSLGYPFIAASNGPSALVALERDPEIAILLSDIIMPERMSGFELAAEAKRRRPDIATVLISGFVGHIPRTGLYQNREYEVLKKPFSEAELSRALIRALTERRTGF
jgi:PAS domain S-box-containing protein